ncbi:MAG: F0F1 ATP synthase subunit B' [Rhodobacteraceae bacterium]|nr:F0F1 ATP synthase subunit B' [Paracoccaceae bacterium]
MANETQTEPVGEGLADVLGIEAHAAADAAPGMPQLDFSTFANQIFWLVIALIAIYLILTRVALPRIDGILSDRQGTITNDIAAAEDLKAKAVEAEEIYNKALADARTEAQQIVAAAKADMKDALNDAIAKADAEIAAKSAESEKAIADIRAGALEAVKTVATDTAAEIVSALGGKADAGRIADAVASRVKG